MDVDTFLFCPIYDKYLNDMHAEKEKVKTNKEKLTIVSKFAKKFTLLPTELSEFARLCERCDQKYLLGRYPALYSKNYGDKNAKHIEWSGGQFIINSLIYGIYKNRYQLIEEALSFPHKNLEYLCRIHCFYSVSPLPATVKKHMESSKIIHGKLKEYENDTDKWLDCIKEIQNKEIVIANLELKLGQSTNWKNKKLWKFYFKLLKKNNMIEILEVFRKYTRLFITDKQAVTHYRNELDKFSSWNFPTTKYWNDTIKYEINYGTLESAYSILERAIKAVIGKPYHFVVKDTNDLYKKLNIFGTKMLKIEKLRSPAEVSKDEVDVITPFVKPVTYYQNVKKQCFPFHQSFIRNLYKNAKGEILRKLYETCKYFYLLKKTPLCYRLEIKGRKRTKYFQESLFLYEKDVNFTDLGNLHVYHILVALDNEARNLIPKIIPKLKTCNVRYLHIAHQDFAVSNLILMLSENIIRALLIDVNITEDDGENIDTKKLYKIFKKYSSLKFLELFNDDQLIIDYPEEDRIEKWKLLTRHFDFRAIYIAHQTVSIENLLMLINYEHMKQIYLLDVTVKGENGTTLVKAQIEEFIKAAVNPINHVVVEIV